MSTTPTERRLAITPGDAKVSKNLFGNRYQFAVYSNGPEGKDYVPIAELYGTHQEQEANLIAESINTYNACGLTPSELLAKLRESEKDRDMLRTSMELILQNPEEPMPRMMARAYLSKHKPE